MKRARLAVGYGKDDYWLASDLPAGMQWGVNAWVRRSHSFFTLVTLLEDLDFSFKLLRVASGAA